MPLTLMTRSLIAAAAPGALARRRGAARALPARLRRHLVRRQLLQHLARGEFAVAQRGVQILHLRVAVVARHRFNLRSW